MHIFLDTEYTDMTPNRQLISLGLCSPNGEEGYWEVPFDRKICSEFVVDNVLPHLGSYANAQCSLKELRANILNWIKIVSDERDLIEICSDSQTDWDLFLKACNYDIPKKISYKYIGENISYPRLFKFFESNQLPEHHALWDAKANCYAYKPNIKF